MQRGNGHDIILKQYSEDLLNFFASVETVTIKVHSE